MGFGAIVGTIAFMFIFIGMAAFAIHTQKQITVAGMEQARQNDNARKDAGMRIEITSTSYTSSSVVAWADNSYSEFSQGLFDNTTAIGPGDVVIDGPSFAGNGSFVSRVLDTGSTATNYTTINWTSVEPANTFIVFQVRAANSMAALSSASFTGPDGTQSTSYSVSGTALNGAVVNESRFFQYRAYFETNSSDSPILQQVSIGVHRPSGVIYLRMTNTGSENLIISETDFYIQGARVLRNETERIYDTSSLTDQLLWLPGQTLGAYVFQTISPPTPVNVANRAAEAGGTIN